MKVKDMIEKLLDGMRRMDCRSFASLGLDFSHIALHSVSVAFVCNIYMCTWDPVSIFLLWRGYPVVVGISILALARRCLYSEGAVSSYYKPLCS